MFADSDVDELKSALQQPLALLNRDRINLVITSFATFMVFNGFMYSL